MAVDFEFTPEHTDSPVSCAASAGKVSRTDDSAPWAWTAPGTAGDVTLTAIDAEGGESKTTISVRGPTRAVGASVIPQALDREGPGVDAIMLVDLEPKTLPFSHLELLENEAPAQNMTGYFARAIPPSHLRAQGAMRTFAISPQNQTGDHVSSPGVPPSARGETGSFSWNIPLNWKVPGEERWQRLQDNEQKFSLMADGEMSVEKWGLTARAMNAREG